jgi:RimJ/RimL family protein N-acetyltransferase
MTHGWPLFDLTLTYEGLVLQPVTDAYGVALAEQAEDIVTPGNEYFMPWLETRAHTIDERARKFLQHHWSRRATWSPDDWELPFAVLLDGHVVGQQTLKAYQFADRRVVTTGSWLTRKQQGRGIGTLMRFMVAELAFTHLEAQYMATTFTEGNHASARVSEKVGYRPNGLHVGHLSFRKQIMHDLLLTRLRWTQTRPAWLDNMQIEHLQPCLPLFLGP